MSHKTPIKKISSETFVAYMEEFHRLLHSFEDQIHSSIALQHELTSLEKDRANDHSLLELFNRGMDIGLSAKLEIKFSNIDPLFISRSTLVQFEQMMRYVVTSDDDALIAVTFDNLLYKYNYEQNLMYLTGTIHAVNRFTKMDIVKK